LSFIPFVVILSSVAAKLGYLHLLSRLIPYIADSLNLDLPLDPILKSIERAQRIGFHRLGLWGTLGLLFGFILSMGNVESAVNRVWNLRRKRSWLGRFRVYAPFLFLLVALVVSGSLLLLKARHGVEKWGFHGGLPVMRVHGKSLLFSAAGVLAFVWIGLSLMIRIVPNTKVKTLPAFYGATASTLLIYLLTRALFLFPSALMAQNRFLYGSLAIFPVILLLAYVVWAAALFGAAVAFIHQRLHNSDAESHVPPQHEQRMARHPWDEVLREVEWIYGRHHT
jgi:membrane protein